MSHTHQRQDFRTRLQRALSLSSSESEKAASPSLYEAGNTTDDEMLQDGNEDGNDCSDDQENSNSADESEEAPRERRMKHKSERDLEIPGQSHPHGDANAVALECVAE